jgi:protease-4
MRPRLGPLSLLVLLLVAPVEAAPLRVSPFRGALVPAGAVAGDADATSLELNPGQLGLLEGGSTALVVDYWRDHVARAGRGVGLLIGTPLFLGLSLGAGFQWMAPTLTGDPVGSKMQLALGQRLGRSAALGIDWEHLFGDRLGTRDSFTIGLGLRLHRTVALGLVVRDLNRPRLADLRLPRLWEAELAVRPFSSDRLEVGLGGRYTEQATHPWQPRARLSVRVRRGLSIFGEFNGARDERDLGAPGASTDTRWSALAGLDVAMGRLGLTAAAVGGEDSAGDGSGAGGSFVLRSWPQRRLPLVAARHIEKVKLEDLSSDTRFLQAVLRLRRLADDPAVGAVLLDIDNLDLGLGRIEELRSLVAGLRTRKPVFASLTSPGTRDYYLAAACDRIVVHPAGALALTGLSQTVTFYKNALDKLGVAVELVRIAEYKGAMEPFVMTGNSEPVRQNRNQLLDDVYSRVLEGIALGRASHGLAAEMLPAVFEHALFSPAEAQQRGLVDAVVDDKEIERYLAESLGRRWPVRESSQRLDPRLWRPARVGVVMIDGAIVDGGPSRGIPLQSSELAFADPILAALDELRGDSSVRAVVLRVNSPGGSAFASDRIARAVSRVRAAGKPVIVSMGDVAASGGYYVAAPGDEILASAGTTTGSIGIFSYKVDLEGLLAKVGVGAETYKRGSHADLFSPFRPWTDGEKGLVREHIGHMYQLFLDTVAAGRKSRGITATRANELGRGRVYSGAQALSVRLVDRLGGFSEALDEAARRGGVSRGPGGLPELVVLPRPVTSPLETLLRLQGLQSEAQVLPLLGRAAPAAARLIAPLLAGKGTGVEARLPYDLELR